MNTGTHRHLEDLLEREVAAAQSLADTLATERTALTGDSPDAIKAEAAEKVRLLGSIEAMEGERRALWGTSAAGGADLSAIVAERWQALLQLMTGCRTANAINGHIIHIRQNQIRQLFDIVRGAGAATYDPHGKTSARTLRALARA